ncbi:hypothetical protein GCM10009839_22780 [Catenulispora yoronensis]|uniref:Integral membrane bound transporter domain-containing protein n=1 Tax=Catenulispora yoronensis TaxID=450799 RepID=A0ABN2TZR1_9ACTN
MRIVRHEARAAADRALHAALHRIVLAWWPILQQAVAAALAWWVARHVFEHDDPLFAPMAAIVALNTPRGERGTNAIRVVAGVVTGVLVGQAASTLLGRNYVGVAAAIFFALLITAAAGNARTTMAQAAVSAVIAVAMGGDAGLTRALDAVFGGAVALLFSQLLFPADPLRLLRRSESELLADLARALDLTSHSLRHDDRSSAFTLWQRLRPLYAAAAELSKACDMMVASAQRSPRRRNQRAPLQSELLSVAHLSLLGNSCLTLSRESQSVPPEHRREFAPAINEAAALLQMLASDPADPALRQLTVFSALDVVGQVPEEGPGRLKAAWESLRWVVHDLAIFAGAKPETAREALG